MITHFALSVLSGLFLPLAWLTQAGQAHAPVPYIQQGPDFPSSLSVSPDGRLLASGDLDGVRIYDLGSGRETLTLQHYSLKSVAFSPDGKFLASAGMDQNPSVGAVSFRYSIRLWLLVNGVISLSAERSIETCSPTTRIGAIAFNPTGRVLAISCDDQNVVLWDIDTNLELLRIKLPSSAMNLAFSPDGKTLAGALISGIAMIWSSADGASLHVLGTPGSNATAVAFTPNGKILAVCRREGISLWESVTGDFVKLIPSSKTIYAVAFAPNGKFLAAGGVTGVQLFDTATWTVSQTFQSFYSYVPAVAYTPDGSALVGAASNQVIVWDSETNSKQYEFTRRTNSVNRLRLSEGRDRLIAESPVDVKVWDYRTGMLLGTISQMQYLFGLRSPDDKLFAAYSVGGISVYRTADGSLDRTYPNTTTRALAFRSDSRVLASGGIDGIVNTWDLSTGKNLLSIDTNEEARKIKVAEGLEVSDPRTMFKNLVSALVFSEDGNSLAAVVSNGSNGENIRIWNAVDGRQRLNLLASDFVTSIAFDQSGKHLACGTDKGQITIWSLETGASVATLEGDTSSVTSILYDPQHNYLISGSSNGQVSVWDLSTNMLLAMMFSTGPEDWLTVTPDGLFDGNPGAMRQVSWKTGRGNEVIPIESFYNDFFTPGVFSQIMNGKRPKPSMDLAATLQLPGLRAMMDEELARIETRDGHPTLCLQELPTANPVVFSDSQPLAFSSDDLTVHKADSLCRFQLRLKTDKQYEVVGRTTLSKRASRKLEHGGSSSTVATSTLHVQTIAIGNYDLSSSGFKSLPTAVHGAKSLENFFRQQSHPAGPYQKIQVWEGVYDQDATREGIENRLKQIAEGVNQNDVLFLFISGHGVVPAGQEMFYFAPIDIRGPDPRRERDTGLNTAMLVDAVRSIPATRILLVIDSCQSGGAVESLEKIAWIKRDLNQELQTGVHVITAASPLEEAIDPEETENDPLVTAILGALKAKGTSTVSVQDLASYIRTELPSLSKPFGRKQTPMIVEVGVDFPLAHQTEGLDGH